MNILYTTNDAFAEKVGTSICSVFENNRREKELSVYVIGQDLSAVSRRRFEKLAAHYHRAIQVIELGTLEDYFDFSFDTLGWNPVILARLLLDRLLPEELDRILYLDGDTVCIRPLADLWETDLGGKVLGACIEATADRKRRESLGMADLPYINSGVLLFDLRKWRKMRCRERIFQYYRERSGLLFAADQDVINAVLHDEICYLPPKYNFYNIYWFYPYRVLKKLMGNAWYYDRETVRESSAHPVILHYLGEERPWRRGNRHKFRNDYERYHARTPWRGEPMESGWELYYLCWGLFHIVTRPFPMIRYRIINGLIPLFMKWRKYQLDKKKRQAKR